MSSRNSFNFSSSSYSKVFGPGMDRPDIRQVEILGHKGFNDKEPAILGMARNNNQVELLIPEGNAINPIPSLPAFATFAAAGPSKSGDGYDNNNNDDSDDSDSDSDSDSNSDNSDNDNNDNDNGDDYYHDDGNGNDDDDDIDIGNDGDDDDVLEFGLDKFLRF